jgi:Fe-S oxidoreductase
LAKNIAGFAPQRSIPLLHKQTLKKWFANRKKQAGAAYDKKLYLFCDEFTNFNDVPVGQKAIMLLEKLGYEVIIPTHLESGRTFLSKGLLKQAKGLAIRNVDLLKNLITEDTPLIGLEPSAILTFRDEYPDLVHSYQLNDAEQIGANSLTFEEFFAKEIDKGNISAAQFTKEKKLLKVHGHCHQKAISSMVPSKKMLSLPENFEVHMIPSGCCGMAGSFGYEKEHYDISMQVGELVLFPTVRKQPKEVEIVAAGTSCRHQIKDGTKRTAKHPAEILFEALV